MLIDNINLKHITFCYALLFISFSAVANQASLSEQAEIIKVSLQSLKKDTSNIKAWDKYLNSFPKNLSKFKHIFAPDDFSLLYNNSHEYIFIFNNAPKSKETKITKIIVSVAKGGAKGCCDSWSALHRVATNYIVKDTKNFMSHIKALKPLERKNFINFIADKENHRVFKQYQIIINNLKELKENNLAQEFEAARTLRKKVKH